MNCPSICKRKLWAPKSGFFINLQSRRKRGTCRGQGGKHSPAFAGIEKTRIRRRNLESIIGSPRFLDLPPVLIGQCQCREMWINFRFAIQCSSGIHTLKRWQKPDSPLTQHSQGKGGDKYWGHGCIYNFMFNLGDQSEIQSTMLEVRSQRFHDKRILNFQEFHSNQSDCCD